MKSFLFLLLFFTCIGANAFAQRTITGKVTDDSGSPLAGVSIAIKGSAGGTQSGPDGNFTINAPGTGNVELVFTSTGYKPFTLSTNGSEPVSIILQKEVSALEDVVVVGTLL